MSPSIHAARRGGWCGLALAVGLAACTAPKAPPPPPTAPSPPLAFDARVTPGLAIWRRLAGAAVNPLRWAYHYARGGPVLLLGEHVLFAAPDGAFILVDARTGAQRWHGAPAGGVQWYALAASPSSALAIGVDTGGTAWNRRIDLADGASVDRRADPKKRHALALGPALAVSDGCDLELLGPDAAPLHTAHGRRTPGPGDFSICIEAAQLVAADAETASLVGWVGDEPRITRVDRRGGAVVDTLALDPGASVRREPHTGLLLVTTTTGSVRALRLGAGAPASQTWAREGAEPLDLRGVHLVDGRTLLLVHDGRRCTAVDPNTLRALWSRTSDGPVALLGEILPPDATAALFERTGALHWLDPRDGAPVARRERASARSLALYGELLLFGGSAGTLALDIRSGAIRWALVASVRDVAPGAHLGVTDLGRAGGMDVIDPTSATRRLHTELRASLLGRVPRDDGDLSLLVVDDPLVLAAFADVDSAAMSLDADPFVALAPTCAAPELVSPEQLERSRGCHPDEVHELDFPGHALPAGALPVLDDVARAWRRSALACLSTGDPWPTLHVRGGRSPAEAPELAERRAAAVRDALVTRGVPCSQILAARAVAADHPRVTIARLGPHACIL